MINEKLKKAKDLVEKGIVDEVQKVLEEAEALKKLPARQEPVLDSSKYTLLMFALPIKSYRFVTFVEHFCVFMRGTLFIVYFLVITFYLSFLKALKVSVWGFKCFSFGPDYYTSLLPAGFWAQFYEDNFCSYIISFWSKLHLGYVEIRDKLAELQEERNKSCKLDRYDERRSKERSRDHERESSCDQWRDYDRRSRDRDTYNDLEHDRDYVCSRTYDSRSCHRSRSRSKEHSRDYDRYFFLFVYGFLKFIFMRTCV
ncbi:hypothetical protein SLE2022_406340 [Rubroshorea leprosula]